MPTKNNYNLLIVKLDQFIRKYYFNKLIRGFLYCTGVVLGAFLLVSLSEWFFNFSGTVRMGLFYGFLGLSALALVGWVLVPLMQLLRLGRVISHEQAAQIIGTHFTNVKDKLLNVLQLKEQSKNYADASLIEASIDQKIDDIKLVPFTSAINLSKNKQYLKYALIPLLFLFGILALAPKLITASTERVIKYDEEFEPDALFKFIVSNAEDLEVVQYEDLTIDVKVEGLVYPNEAQVYVKDFPYKLKKVSPSEFSYKFNKLQKTTEFYLEADGVKSKTYTINVIPKPTMLSFDASLDYPSYVGKKDEVLRNSGDMIVPAGTKVRWSFEAENTDEVNVKFGSKGKLNPAERKGETLFSYSRRFSKDIPYTIYLSNKQIENADSISYNISVIPDLYPTISAEEKRDENDPKYLYFLGDASDDYGIKSLYFKYKIEPKGKSNNNYEKLPIEAASKTATSFTHTWDLNTLGLNPGDRLTYFFEVWDNDGVAGSKSARSQMMTYELPTIKEMDDEVEAQTEEIKDDLETMVEEAKELREEIKEMKEDMLQKKELDWEDKAKIEDLIQQHNKLQKQVENVQQNFDKNLEKQQEYKDFSEETQEKYEKLQEMMEELMTDEMKELMKKLEDLMEEMKKEDIMEELEDFEMEEEQMEEDLDRMLELMKQLEFEQKMEETIDKLEELAEEQEELSEETEQEQEGSDMKEEEEKQEELNEKFEDLKEDMKELDEMAEELDKKEDISEQTEQMQEDISEKQENSMEEMQQGKAQKASQEQKDAAQKMQEMAQQMQMMQMQMQQQQQEEDMQAIRQLLENLINLSMDQEDLMDDLALVDINTPRYVDLVQQQNKIKDDAEIVEDSLVALSKRVFQLESFITKELKEVKRNMKDAIKLLADRKKNNGATNQQFIMTGLNNLALMLDEVQQQMQQQMAQQMQGSQMCQNPGNKPGAKGMGKMQQQLNDQIKKMEQGMKSGKMPGGKQMSKEAAQMAQRQAAIRQALEQMGKDGEGGKGGDGGEISKMIEEMEETETDLVNKRITAEMVQRQKNIMEKLLKFEKAQQQRELDDKRLAETAKQRTRKMPPEIEEYLKKRESEIELYRTVPPSLKPFYRSLVEQYFKSISF